MPALPAPLPTEKLRDAVDLIVVPAVGKGQQLIEKLAQPGRVPGKDEGIEVLLETRCGGFAGALSEESRKD